jgi:hypothetical protein
MGGIVKPDLLRRFQIDNELVEACRLTLTIYPNRPEKPRLLQFFDKRIVEKFS